MYLFRKKLVVTDDIVEQSSLKRCLNAFDLTLLGIGAIIGAGVFVLTGIAAATKAGPAICISYVIAGLASMFAALSYAELATSIGGCGSAYNYSYVAFGELVAWIIGWDLMLEYALSVSTVAIGWSGYVNNGLQALSIHLPEVLLRDPFEGGVCNVPAVLVIACLATLLCAGIRQTARFNAAIVFIKLATIALFIGFAVINVNTQNWNVFFPFGWNGVMEGAALVFFAYIGFDALSTAVEETIEPQKNVPIGIVTSVIICTVIYIIVSVLLTTIVPYNTLNVKSPVADALLRLGYPVAAGFISAGAIAGLTTVMLVMYYGLTRVCLAISRDGLLPPVFAQTHAKTLTPVKIIVVSGIVMALIAGFMPMGQVAELVNIGTLSAFVLVCGGVVALRYSHPDLPRPFRLPWSPLVPLLGVVFCLYLIVHLAAVTLWFFLFWMIVGLIIYFSYGVRNSKLK